MRGFVGANRACLDPGWTGFTYSQYSSTTSAAMHARASLALPITHVPPGWLCDRLNSVARSSGLTTSAEPGCAQGAESRVREKTRIEWLLSSGCG